MKSIKIYDFFNHDLIIYVICFRFTINSRLNHLCYFLKSTHRRGSQIPPWFPLQKNLYLWVNSNPLKFNPNLIIVLNFSENLIIEILFFSLFFDYSGITWQRMIIKFMELLLRSQVGLFPMLLIGMMLFLQALLLCIFFVQVLLINYSFDFCDWNLSLIWICLVFVWWLGLLFEIWFCGESFPEKAQCVKFKGSGPTPTTERSAKAVCISLNFGFCVLLYVYSSFMSFRVAWYMQFDFCFFYVF